jgi:hypothetical protein
MHSGLGKEISLSKFYQSEHNPLILNTLYTTSQNGNLQMTPGGINWGAGIFKCKK